MRRVPVCITIVQDGKILRIETYWTININCCRLFRRDKKRVSNERNEYECVTIFLFFSFLFFSFLFFSFLFFSFLFFSFLFFSFLFFSFLFFSFLFFLSFFFLFFFFSFFFFFLNGFKGMGCSMPLTSLV